MLPSDIWKEYWQVEPARLAPGWPWTQGSHVRFLEGGEATVCPEDGICEWSQNKTVAFRGREAPLTQLRHEASHL